MCIKGAIYGQASSHISRGTVDHLPRIYLPPHGQQNMGCLRQALQKNLGKEAKTGATRKIDDWSSVRLYAVAGRFCGTGCEAGDLDGSRASLPVLPHPVSLESLSLHGARSKLI